MTKIYLIFLSHNFQSGPRTYIANLTYCASLCHRYTNVINITIIHHYKKIFVSFETTSMMKACSKHILGSRSYSYFSPESVLGEENVKTTIAKFSNFKPVRFHTHQPARKAAVLVPICQIGNKVSLLYTLRANISQKGQVSEKFILNLKQSELLWRLESYFY